MQKRENLKKSKLEHRKEKNREVKESGNTNTNNTEEGKEMIIDADIEMENVNPSTQEEEKESTVNNITIKQTVEEIVRIINIQLNEVEFKELVEAGEAMASEKKLKNESRIREIINFTLLFFRDRIGLQVNEELYKSTWVKVMEALTQVQVIIK